ncbi:MAG: O-antigen ligase family protein [Polaromonas sp.]|nr:O-antigen ligase family protein [Polaromonas sp.]
MPLIETNSKGVKNWQWSAVLLLLVLAPLNSKLAGACWLALFLIGVWSFKRGSAQESTAEFSAAKGWVFACLAALALRTVTQFYWGDSWGERHAEFRLLFGALGLLGLVHYARFTSVQLTRLGYALVLALWAGFGWMLVFGAALAPTNQIPWGASMSLLVCVVLALTFSTSSQRLPVRLFYASGVVVGVCAVLLSQARGSYGIVLWVAGVVLWHYARSGIRWPALASRVMVAVIAITLLVQIFPQLISIPAQRVQLAMKEFSAMDSSKEVSIDTSVGIRLYLWKRAIEKVPDHLVLGVGREERMASIQRWGVEVNSTAVQRLGHVHNNYIEELFDQGLFGLASFLSYLVGLGCMVMRLRKEQKMAALGIAGVFFMHATSSLTNVNFAHNYYPTMLSVAVSLSFIILINKSNRGKE